MTGKLTRLIFSALMSVDQMTHPRIPGGDLSLAGWGMGPLDQASELCRHTLPEMRKSGILSFGQALGP